MKRVHCIAAVVAMVGLPGCGAEVEDPSVEAAEAAEDSKYEAFSSATNPARITGESFIFEVGQLPVEGHTTAVPIAGDYWATARDSINFRWNGSDLSPAEKVEQAFSLAGFAKYVTDNYGIYQAGFRACNASSECTDLMDGSSCVFPRTREMSAKPGRCVPGWWGICHGWAPYAINEPSPKKSVVKNGVTFYPGDLTALMSFVYGEDLPTKFLSGRCNLQDKNITYDGFGRIREGECRDNPGSIYIIATNLLGKRQQGFVVDRTTHAEVWNQPVEGFKITNAVNNKLKEVTKAEAIGLLGLGYDYSQLLAATDIAKDVEKTGSYTATVAGEIIIKTTGTEGDADLFVKKGAGVTRSANDCSSTGSTASEECAITVAAGDTISWLVFGYSASKQVAVQVGVPGSGANYTYNTTAKRFFHVEMDLFWVAEQGPGTTQPDPRNSLRADHLSMILEADDAGRVVGGEWLGESKKNHTDFIWWGTSKPSPNINGLTYAMVKELNDQAAESTGPPATEERTVLEKAIRYSANVVPDYIATVGVPAGVKKVEVRMTGTGGDADLYVRFGANPTTTTFTAKSTSATATEMVAVTVPANGGSLYVRARVPYAARTATVNVKVVAKFIR